MEITSLDKLHATFRSHPVICTDTRKLTKGSIFFALKGTNFDGNSFAAKAIESGCAYAVIDDASLPPHTSYLLVEDVLKSLQALAMAHRALLKIPFIGITGSNGKTTTKELLNAVLSRKYKTHATEGNLNNHIGVPLTILSITDDKEIAIIEMGANHSGEIAQLCEIARIDYGLITNVGKAHLEGFGSPEGVIKAKGELYQYIEKNSGKIFLNRDNPALTALIKTADTYTYGTSGLCNILGRVTSTSPHVKIKWKTNTENELLDNKEEICSQLTGSYNAENILTAICVGNYFSVPAQEIKSAIESYKPSNNRSQLIETKRNTVLLDAYNANPTSMRAAIENFASMSGEKKVLILGDMLELGNFSATEHKEILELVKSKNFSHCIFVGPLFKDLIKPNGKTDTVIASYNSAEEAMKSMKTAMGKLKDHQILIKGSRGIKLETLADLF